MADLDDMEVLKEPLARLHLIEETATKAFEAGDIDQSLCLRMTVKDIHPFISCIHFANNFYKYGQPTKHMFENVQPTKHMLEKHILKDAL